MRRLPSSRTRASHLIFMAYDVHGDFALGNGFVATVEHEVSYVTDDLLDIEGLRDRLDHDIDELVVKVASLRSRYLLGHGSKYPRWALAFKVRGESREAVLLDIETAVGKTGKLGLRARITPTELDGSTISYATLHNAAFVAEHGIGIGATVTLEKAGDVIPRITSGNGGTPWTPPTNCP